ncbi:MAG: tRNA (adenosine(37)-N6)-threonylcarbamoyltransferase complex dimerization subunit type 1 TsaB [Kiritimatiellae bacterium]|nr:tRNA (adenosine(37)-N6)-threonylcarbamoyltransferase complex dimerization subunit type 1 TsaB [Kiritimatiellia bacterium]
MTYTLALERSAPTGSLALYDGERPVLTRAFDTGHTRAPEWVAAMGAALDAAGVPPAALARLLVGTGPGSFSGIRSALAALHGLALPFDIPVLGLSSAAALARREALVAGADTVAVIGDARRNQLWHAVYRLSSAGRLSLAATGAAPGHDGDDFVLCGWDELPALLPANALLISPDAPRLTAAKAGARLADLLAADVAPVTADDLVVLWHSDPDAARRDPVPVYLHPAVAT